MKVYELVEDVSMLQDPVVRAQAGKTSYGGGLFDTVCHLNVFVLQGLS